MKRCRLLLFSSAAAVSVTLIASASWACVPLKALLAVRPQSFGAPGASVTVVGLGFGDSPVELRWNSADGPELGKTAGPDFSASATIPQVPDGLYSVVVLTRDQNQVITNAATTPFLVTASGTSPVRSASSAAGSLAPVSAPSSSSTPIAVWVLGALAVGGATAVLVWRQRKVSKGNVGS